MASEPRQKLWDRLQSPELCSIRNSPPMLVIQILLSAASISSGRLQMPVRVATNPNLRPCWRNCKRLDARDVSLISQRTAVAIEIDKSFAVQSAGEARFF